MSYFYIRILWALILGDYYLFFCIWYKIIFYLERLFHLHSLWLMASWIYFYYIMCFVFFFLSCFCSLFIVSSLLPVLPQLYSLRYCVESILFILILAIFMCLFKNNRSYRSLQKFHSGDCIQMWWLFLSRILFLLIYYINFALWYCFMQSLFT